MSTDPAPLALFDVDDNGELRPSLLRTYSEETEKCFRKRLRHYQRWCALEGLQPDTEWITADKLRAYLSAQIKRWGVEPEDAAPADYRMLRPETLRQAKLALVVWAERAGVPIPEREARTLLGRFRESWPEPKLWHVPRRAKPNSRRRK